MIGILLPTTVIIVFVSTIVTTSAAVVFKATDTDTATTAPRATHFTPAAGVTSTTTATLPLVRLIPMRPPIKSKTRTSQRPLNSAKTAGAQYH
jgi:hypothetical protein